MNPLAQQALARARGKALPAPTEKPRQTPTFAQIVAAPPLPELVITGPINRVMELEGKRYALDFVRALGSSIRQPKVAAQAIADLTRYAAQRPSSVASGVKIVIDLLKVAP
jgi:hypothetical protein